MTENKRFRVTIGNENDVRLVDYEDNRQLLTISFKDYKDAVDCRDALLYQCNLMNELNDMNQRLQKENKILYDENIQLRNKLLHFIQLKDDVKYLEEKGVF